MTWITDERLEYLATRQERYAKAHRATGSPVAGQECEDNAAALRELQRLRHQHREIICRQCYLREQLGAPDQIDTF